MAAVMAAMPMLNAKAAVRFFSVAMPSPPRTRRSRQLVGQLAPINSHSELLSFLTLTTVRFFSSRNIIIHISHLPLLSPFIMAAHRDPITCHALNILSGTPAAGLACTLTIYSVQLTNKTGPHESSLNLPVSFVATTDQDGRVNHWEPGPTSTAAPGPTLADLTKSIEAAYSAEERSELRFICGVHFGGVDEFFAKQGVETLWPEVDIRIIVKGWEGSKRWRHYHVPVLLGPWNYTTYRGS